MEVYENDINISEQANEITCIASDDMECPLALETCLIGRSTCDLECEYCVV